MLNGLKSILRRIFNVTVREVRIMRGMPIYTFCLVFFPLIVAIFFTTLLNDGTPENMPVGVVDLDNTATTRAMVRKLDAMQSSRVVAHYNNVNEARQAIQRNQIYGFLYIPNGTTSRLYANKQPKVSYYVTQVPMLAGSMIYKDIKTVTTLASAAVGSAKLSALGMSSKEIAANLQPIKIDLHMINNPYSSYNIYLSTYLVPGLLLVFVFLLVPYSIWTEVKFGRSREWLKTAGGSLHLALIGKLIPLNLMFIVVMLGFEFYIYGYLDFPHQGGYWPIVFIGIMAIFSCEGFAIFVASLIPSLRMSMSVCTLWSVLSFSMCGCTFPVTAMHPMLRALAALFPLRHYIVFYQICIFDGFPFNYAVLHIAMLFLFLLLPLFGMRRLKRNLMTPIYIP